MIDDNIIYTLIARTEHAVAVIEQLEKEGAIEIISRVKTESHSKIEEEV